MSCVGIIKNGLEGFSGLEELIPKRGTEVKILDGLGSDCINYKVNTILCSSTYESNMGGTQKLITQAREFKVNKIIVTAENADKFSVKTELGGALIRISCPNDADRYSIQVAALHCMPEKNIAVGDKNTFDLMHLARKVANTDVTVFINGPTGTGKEVIANYIHDNSIRKSEPFVALNCAAIPENMLEAMLFGHEKGSFTGASQANKGIFRAADGGTLLLDEISEMPLSLQAKLLRVLQEKTVTPVGGTREINVNVRVLATTNREMIQEVNSNRFREDLYYRLNVFPLRTVNLKDRKDDIIPISAFILDKHISQKELLPYLSVKAQEILLSHDWQGNVRELENVLQRALVLSDGLVINDDDIMIDDTLNKNSSNEHNNLIDRLAVASAG